MGQAFTQRKINCHVFQKERMVQMTVSLNEVSSLICKLQSIMDDSGNDILHITIGSRTHVQMKAIDFLIEFMEYEIEVDDEIKYSFTFTAYIAGVKFVTVMSAVEVVNLKERIPAQWEYIQKKVQMEVNI